MTPLSHGHIITLEPVVIMPHLKGVFCIYSVEEIRAKKKELKLTTADIANSTELPVSTVSKIMTGETKNPSYITIEKIDDFIRKEEFRARVDAYLKVLKKYMEEHPDEIVDQYKFFYDYVEEHPLHEERPVKNRDVSLLWPWKDLPFVSDLALADKRGMTIDDLRNMEESRYIELIDGCIIHNESPRIEHHNIVRSIGKQIDKYIDANNGSCIMYDTGVGVIFKDNEYNYFIPDIVVVCNKDIIDSEGILGGPDWVIEITSPSTRAIDYKTKMHKYMYAGVREYWIVDLEKEKVAVHFNGEPMMVYIYGIDEEIPVRIYDEKLKIRIEVLS